MRAQVSGFPRSRSAVFSLLVLAVGMGCSGANAGLAPQSVEGSPQPSSAQPSSAQPSSARPSRVQQELALTSEALDELSRESHLALAPELGEQLAHVRKELGWLSRKAPSWQSNASVEELAQALVQHRQLLAELRQLPSSAARPLLVAVLRDLQIKAQQCRRFGGPVPVNVSVVTRDIEQREVAGYEVWFVRKAYERRPSAARRFERHSSPAGRVFAEAGYYVLWAVPPGQSPGASSARLDVEVGGSEQEQIVDLTAPALETAATPVSLPPEAASAASAP